MTFFRDAFQQFPVEGGGGLFAQAFAPIPWSQWSPYQNVPVGAVSNGWAGLPPTGAQQLSLLPRPLPPASVDIPGAFGNGFLGFGPNPTSAGFSSIFSALAAPAEIAQDDLVGQEPFGYLELPQRDDSSEVPSASRKTDLGGAANRAQSAPGLFGPIQDVGTGRPQYDDLFSEIADRPLRGSGHHMVTNEVARRYGWSDDARKVFDAPRSQGGGRIPVDHNFDKDHQNYNTELNPFVENYLKNNEIDPGKMTADQAREMIAEINKQPALRAFNMKMYLKGIWQAFRRIGGGKGDVD